MEKRVDALGSTGERVGTRLAAIRRSRYITLAELAAKLADLGRPILLTALSKIEKGQRRVDVDDLVALALALEVTPNALLLPDQSDPATTAQLTPTAAMATRQAWEWATRDRPATTAGHMKNSIFISYAQGDGSQWARWIAFVLERNGYQVMMAATDITPGANLRSYLTDTISTAACVIVVMTKGYLLDHGTQLERDLIVAQRASGVIPVQVDQTRPTGLLGAFVGLDLASKDKTAASAELLEAMAAIGVTPRKTVANAPWPAESDG